MAKKNIYQFTGLSGSGKSILSNSVKEQLCKLGYSVSILDGDIIRKEESSDLGFSKSDRLEHLKRVASMAKQLETDYILLAVINPYEESRQFFKETCSADIIYLKCELDVLKQRDPKGLYKRAFLPNLHPEKILNLTGVNDVYDEPTNADLELNTGELSIDESVSAILKYIIN